MSNWYPGAGKPRPVEDGIRARSKRGAIAQTWWSERFIKVLESLGVGGRLARGRTYARKGQVIDLRIDAGAVTARVQGSRGRPYRVRMGITTFDKTEWSAVSEALADNAWFAAKLLGGEMPEDIEHLFASVGLDLFPNRPGDIVMDCTCPDWSVPCKHLAAVCYLLAESFDEDPFGILAWRGRDREELLEILAALRTGAVPADQADAGAAVPLTDVLGSYFDLQGPISHGAVEPGVEPAVEPATRGAVLDLAPEIEGSIRGTALVDIFRPAYLRLTRQDESLERSVP